MCMPRPPAAVYINNSQVINLILTNLTQGKHLVTSGEADTSASAA